VIKVETAHFTYQFNSDSEWESALSGFQVLQSGVENLFHSAQVRSPGFPHVGKARVHVAAEIVEPGIVDKNPDQHRQCGYTHCECRLNGGVSHLI